MSVLPMQFDTRVVAQRGRLALPLSPGCERLPRRASDTWVGRLARASERSEHTPASHHGPDGVLENLAVAAIVTAHPESTTGVVARAPHILDLRRTSRHLEML